MSSSDTDQTSNTLTVPGGDFYAEWMGLCMSLMTKQVNDFAELASEMFATTNEPKEVMAASRKAMDDAMAAGLEMASFPMRYWSRDETAQVVFMLSNVAQACDPKLVRVWNPIDEGVELLISSLEGPESGKGVALTAANLYTRRRSNGWVVEVGLQDLDNGNLRTGNYRGIVYAASTGEPIPVAIVNIVVRSN